MIMKMRKIFAVMLLAATAMGFNSCSDETRRGGVIKGKVFKILLLIGIAPIVPPLRCIF